MKPIREALLLAHGGDETLISYEQMKILFAIFEYERGVAAENEEVHISLEKRENVGEKNLISPNIVFK
jgi:hypothetical protein